MDRRVLIRRGIAATSVWWSRYEMERSTGRENAVLSRFSRQQTAGFFHYDAMRAMSSGGHGSSGELLSVLREVSAALSEFRSMPAGEVVTKGARGLINAMDRDAGLTRMMGQRQRLA